MKTKNSDKTLLIVNADDFGESQEVNNGIIEAHRNGIVTSASLMANMPAFDHAINCIRENPTLDVGVHLNVHRGVPLTDCPTITRDGMFLKNPLALIYRGYTGRTRVREEITHEFDAQMKKIIASGVHISHLDTEKHLHVFPFIFDIVLEIAKKYNIPAIRLPYERAMLTTLFNPSQLMKTAVMTLTSPWNMYLLKKSGRKSPHHFYGVSLSKKFTVLNVEKLLRKLPKGISELSCHPGYAPDAIKTYIDAYRKQELDTLTDPGLKEYARERGIVLSTFSDIG